MSRLGSGPTAESPLRKGTVPFSHGENRGNFQLSRAVSRPVVAILALTLGLSGCSLLPEITHEPTLHNPFPQLSKVAVAPFFNLSTEPTLDARRFSLAYFNELQLVPGFEVVPIGVVEKAMEDNKITLSGPEEVRRLAQVLGVDAVAVGAVTDYSPYYPPRCALQVEWYAANPCFHPIPAGYGLPWGTPGELEVPGSLVFEAEYELAKAQLATQTPSPSAGQAASDGGTTAARPVKAGQPASGGQGSQPPPTLFQSSLLPSGSSRPEAKETTAASSEDAAVRRDGQVVPAGFEDSATATTDAAEELPPGSPGFPPDWPDPHGFIPPSPVAKPPTCRPSDEPVLRHTQAYNGHDPRFTEALATYYYFQEDARFGGWQGYLERSDDFIRFCCRMHIWEMLSARGGAGETRVVWRWPLNR